MIDGKNMITSVPGTEVMMTPKGSMITGVFCTLLEHFSKFKIEGSTLLVFHGDSSHFDAEIVTKEEKDNIALVSLIYRLLEI